MIEIIEGDEDRLSQEEVQKRRGIQARFILAFRAYPDVFERIGDLCHFFSAAQNERDIALQNVYKSILHEGGFWGDSDEDRASVLGRIIKHSVPRRTFWQKLLGR
jgi:hypothetical protein